MIRGYAASVKVETRHGKMSWFVIVWSPLYVYTNTTGTRAAAVFRSHKSPMRLIHVMCACSSLTMHCCSFFFLSKVCIDMWDFIDNMRLNRPHCSPEDGDFSSDEPYGDESDDNAVWDKDKDDEKSAVGSENSLIPSADGKDLDAVAASTAAVNASSSSSSKLARSGTSKKGSKGSSNMSRSMSGKMKASKKSKTSSGVQRSLRAKGKKTQGYDVSPASPDEGQANPQDCAAAKALIGRAVRTPHGLGTVEAVGGHVHECGCA